MRQQLRLRVILPVAVLGLLGAGFGAFAYGKPPEAVPVPPGTTQAEKPEPPAKAKSKGKKATRKPAAGKPAKRPAAPSRTALERALRAQRAVVVVFRTPGGGVDTVAVREARAGAIAAGAGFLAVNVARNAAVSDLARRYEVREAPAVLVFLRGPKVAAHFDGYADRDTVAQAVSNALR